MAVSAYGSGTVKALISKMFTRINGYVPRFHDDIDYGAKHPIAKLGARSPMNQGGNRIRGVPLVAGADMRFTFRRSLVLAASPAIADELRDARKQYRALIASEKFEEVLAAARRELELAEAKECANSPDAVKVMAVSRTFIHAWGAMARRDPG